MLQAKLPEHHPSHPAPNEALGDLRFRALLSAADWAVLPQPIRRRFSKRVAGGETAVYVGQVAHTQLSRTGWLFAQLARLCGGPLPLSELNGVPAVVTVTEDLVTGGQIWTRLYARRNGFPQVIHSSKCFAGPTGLEEYVGRGVGMELTVHVEQEALVFRSARYFFRVGWFAIRLPAWLTPGALTVTHTELGEGRFTFTLDVVHPIFGRVVHQLAIFQEVAQ